MNNIVAITIRFDKECAKEYENKFGNRKPSIVICRYTIWKTCHLTLITMKS